MRVTQGMVTAQVERQLQAALAAISHQQGLIANGTRIVAPSDDPGGAAQAITIRSRQSVNSQFQKNVTAAQTALSSADTALRAISETVTQVQEAAVQGASDSSDALARQSIGANVNQLLETLVSLANSQSGTGQFIFGGQESRTAPYTVTRDAAGQITAVTPNARGIEGTTLAEVSGGVTVATTVSGTSIFGAASDPGYAFDVLIGLRDSLNGRPLLTLQPDVSANGAANASAFAGIAANDLSLGGPTGTAFVPATAAADDAVSYSGNATSAIAAAAEINTRTALTGVTATATRAQIEYSAGSFASNVTLDPLAAPPAPGQKLVINGVAIVGTVSGATASDRRDSLVALINGQSGGTGVVASAVSGGDGFALTAADGRNISIETDGTTTAGSANAVLFGFATGLTGTGAATSVVARGGVKLSASQPITVTPATGSPLSTEMSGQGTTGIQDALGKLGGVLDHVLAPSTEVGARLSMVGLLSDRLQSQSLELASNLSDVQDVDIASAAIQLQQLQTFYQGALSSSAQIIQLSLLNFLR
jgi:flagellar hook-associated protein 3 FlgL